MVIQLEILLGKHSFSPAIIVNHNVALNKTTTMKSIATTLVFLFASMSAYTANAQTCTNDLPTGTYSGETTQGQGGLYGNDNVTVTKNGNTYTISDVSAGFIDEIEVLNQDYSISIEINCDGSVVPVTRTSTVGPIKILSGNWNESTKTLTYDWTIETSGISETTKLTYPE